MSRTRNKDNTTGFDGYGTTVIKVATPDSSRYFAPNGVSYADPGTYTIPVPTSHGITPRGGMGSVEYMEDSLSPNGFNRCYHTKVVWSAPLKPFTMTGVCNRGGCTVVTTGAAGALDACLFGSSSMPFMATDELMLAEACSAINPQAVKPVFDMAQQVGEAIEAGQGLIYLAQAAENIAKSLKRQNELNSPLVRRILGQRTFDRISIRDLATLAVSLDLGYQLAIKPTIQAFADMAKGVNEFDSRVEKYYGSVQVLHGVSLREETNTNSFIGDVYTNNYGNIVTSVKEVHATAEVVFHSPESDALREALRSALFGLRPNVQTAYELTSLSFVLDYWVNFSKYLGQFVKTKVPAIQYTVLRSGWSRKETITSDGWVFLATGPYAAGYSAGGVAPLITGQISRTTYFREPKVLVLDGFQPKPPDIKLPSVGQLKTMAELVYTIRQVSRSFLRVAKATRAK